MKMTKPQKGVVGWREWIGLPDLGIAQIKAKVDTGARTSALHAVDLELMTCKGVPHVRFRVPSTSQGEDAYCLARVVDERPIKNTSGIPQPRYMIETTLVLGRRHWQIELSLANREEMEFDVILGRTAIRNHRLVVDPRRSFLIGPPTLPRRAGLPPYWQASAKKGTSAGARRDDFLKEEEE